MNALNPSNGFKAYKKCYPGTNGEGWYRFSEIIFPNESLASGAACQRIEILIEQMFNYGPGCFHEIEIYMRVDDKAKITSKGQNTNVLKKVRVVRKNTTIFLDMYSAAINNDTHVLLNIPIGVMFGSAKLVEAQLVPETADGETVVCSVDLADNI